jgi:cobalt-precorrin-5B (C1)-methyltransferase
MNDPVSGFLYPESWGTGLNEDEQEAVQSGLCILTADGTILRRGFTTGTTAAAAAKAAVISLFRPVTDRVEVNTPAGIRVVVPCTGSDGHGFCRKWSGDYPGDVTAGLCFHAEATLACEGVSITTGAGIGIWGRKTPRYQKGAPAISPPAYEEIMGAIAEGLSETGIAFVQVRLSVQGGEEVAKKTLNEKIGVFGGISVLGSTGFVEPWDDHLEESCNERIAVASHVILTTGRVGLRFSRLLFPEYEVILVGSRLGPALAHAKGSVVICGLPALILKYINPAILEGSGFGSVEEMLGTTEFAIRAEGALTSFCAEHQGIRVILLSRDGKIIIEAP